MATAPRVRFAPSPTGYLHVGGARTAIFNLLYARHHGGTFILRVEDTDVERSRQHHAEQIVQSLQWLGVEWDEGPIFQSDRLDLYRRRASQLVEEGKAYRCVCTVEQLEAERADAEGRGRQYRYSGRCRGSREDVSPSTPHVIRFQVRPGPIRFRDHVRGDVEFDGELIDDFVLLRSDGNPTYHLSVVVDDVDMGITLVARGDDHLSNTPKHVLLFEAFGAPVPEFAHVPLILGADRKRLSKRTGATSVEEYQSLGVLSEALFNFLLLLGWSPPEGREILTRKEAESTFELSDVHRSAAVFDVEKLFWLNHQYIQSLPAEELVPKLIPFLGEDEGDREALPAIVRMLQPRARTLKEMADQARPFVTPGEIGYEPDAVQKHIRGAELLPRMEALRVALASAPAFDTAATEAAVRKLAEESGVSAAKYIHPLRVALTGKTASPSIFEVLTAMGKEKSLSRLDRLIEKIPLLVGSSD